VSAVPVLVTRYLERNPKATPAQLVKEFGIQSSTARYYKYQYRLENGLVSEKKKARPQKKKPSP
jgi:hypothetical protein